MLERLLEWDRETLIYLNNLGTETFDDFWLTLTKFTTWIPLFLFLIALILFKHPIKRAVKMLLFYAFMVLSAAKIIFSTKDVFARLRPNNDETINDLIRVLLTPSDYSFFSGHAAASFCIAALGVFFLRKNSKWMYLLFLWPLLFSYSRIYLGVHYPLDILVGALFGCMWAILFWWAFRKIRLPYLG